MLRPSETGQHELQNRWRVARAHQVELARHDNSQHDAAWIEGVAIVAIDRLGTPDRL